MLLLRELRSTSVQRGRLSNQSDESRIETWQDECQEKQDETQRHLTTTTPWHLHLPPGSLVTGFETTSSAGSRDGYPAQGAGARIGVDFNARVTSVTPAPATRVPG